jgi:hypothetical protein
MSLFIYPPFMCQVGFQYTDIIYHNFAKIRKNGLIKQTR